MTTTMQDEIAELNSPPSIITIDEMWKAKGEILKDNFKLLREILEHVKQGELNEAVRKQAILNSRWIIYAAALEDTLKAVLPEVKNENS